VAVAHLGAVGEVDALHYLSLVAQHEGRYHDQLSWAEKAYQTAARGENQQLVLGALSAMATAHGSLGALDRALEVEESALTLARELGDPQRLAHTLYGLGWLRNCIGAYPEAKASLEEAIELGRQSGNRRAEAYALHNVGLSYLRTGDALRAIAAEEAAIEIGERTENQRVIAVSKLYMAFILTEMAQLRAAAQGRPIDPGSLNQALAAARATISIAGATAMPYLEAVARAAVAHAHLLRDSVDEALAEAEQAIAIRDKLEGIDENEELVLWVHHLVLRRAERWQEADAAGGRARSFILERASRLKDQRVRQSYLTRVPLHAAIFGGGPGPDGKIGYRTPSMG
jgi:tetratricopeptide (TPR) repeat protein